MKMPQRRSKLLRERISADASSSFLWAADASLALGDLARGTSLGGALGALEGSSVVLATPDQLTTALALIELDGVARRLVLCPPDLPAEQLGHVIATAQADAVVAGVNGAPAAARDLPLQVTCRPAIVPADVALAEAHETEWIMLTSGTTGAPKMVVHTLESLTAAIRPIAAGSLSVVWGTFYDMRRYGGLQIFLRAVLGGTSFVLSSASEPMGDHLARLGLRGVTHLTGTPSHWRWALLNPSARAISPRYVRLSGEIADQAILDALREFFPAAAVGHAYASTEAGVGFEVNDGREGFPASMIGSKGAAVDMKVVDGSLRIRSTRTAADYLGRTASTDQAAACSMPTASSTPATSWSCAATATISSAGVAESSMSAASKCIPRRSKLSSTAIPRCKCRW
jgi:non-ribosomal peptide synthetase component F